MSQYIDTNEFTRLGRVEAGTLPLTSLARMTADLPEQLANAAATWDVRGQLIGEGLRAKRILFVHVHASPTVICQRCLQPFTLAISSDNRLEVVDTEAELDGHEDSDDEPDLVERILASPRLDLLALVEDELILALPYVPKHEVCPALPDALKDEGKDVGRSSPFAVLSQLKKD